MANRKSKLSLAELLILVALVAGMFGFWRRFGTYWSLEEHWLAISWLGGWLAGCLGGRSIGRRAELLGALLCGIGCGTLMACQQKPWQVVAVVAAAAGILAAIGALILHCIQAVIRNRPALFNRGRAKAIGMTVLSSALVVAALLGLPRLFWPGARPYQTMRPAHFPSKATSPLKSNRDAHFLATEKYPGSGSVVVFDTWRPKMIHVELPDNIWAFHDLSPSGNQLLLADDDGRMVVANRLTRTSSESFGKPDRWGRFVAEDQVVMETRGGVGELWELSEGVFRCSYRHLPDKAAEIPEFKAAWLASFPIANWSGNPARRWYFQGDRNPGRVLEFVGVGADAKTAIFLEWETGSYLPASRPRWTESLPYFRRAPFEFIRVSLAAVDVDHPGRIRRSATIDMDYVLGHFDSVVLSALMSGDRQTVIVHDGHYNVAMWRVGNL